MLVDNGVEGDSRVQKAARSMAEAGWDVVLLGCAPIDAPREWRLGPARVRVLPLAGARTGADGRLSQPRGLRERLLSRGGLPLRLARLARRPLEHAQVWSWRAVMGDRAWRRLEPGLWNYERTFGAVVDELAPDLIHAHDFRMLGVGARAVLRARDAGRPVKLVWDVHEFLPGVRPWRDNARWLPAHLGYEREYAPYADAVVTVSGTLADLLRREHRLRERPAVVLNAPTLAAPPHPNPEPVADLRRLCGLDRDTPLLVYSGSVSPQRGVQTVVEALPELAGAHLGLPELAGAHLGLVVNDPDTPHVRRLLATAARLGVADRVHPVPYVPYWQVVEFLGTADIGVIPIHHWPNHELALITKFFEYSHARLPIVVSDVKTMADTVRATGQGEVFRARDTADFVRAVRAVIADPGRYRRGYERPDSPLSAWTWEAQAAVLDSVYRRLLPRKATAA
ncbi:MAG: glycosyltransferase family 4 protein [Micromonosporaceae bacterium]